MKSKTIIISSQDENSKGGRGILTLFQEDDLLKSRLRLYNTPKLTKFCKLGIYHNEEVFSANLLEKNGVYESSMVGDFDIDNDFYCAIIDTNSNNKVLLAGGTYAGFFFNDNSVFENKNISNEEIFKSVEMNNPETEIAKMHCFDECQDKCANCKYKEFFYSQTNLVESSHNQTEKIDSEKPMQIEQPVEHIELPKEDSQKVTAKILESIIPQFKYIFENYNPNDELNSMLPNSKFVKINENNEEYSIGALYEDENIKFLCYALKCDYNVPAPSELGEHYQWLPIDKEDPLSEGYYIVFQDATDLKIVEL